MTNKLASGILLDAMASGLTAVLSTAGTASAACASINGVNAGLDDANSDVCSSASKG